MSYQMRKLKRHLNPESVAVAEKNSQSPRFQMKFSHPRAKRGAGSLPASPWVYILRRWRDKKELTAQQAAATIGVPFDTYRGWEAGKHLPSDFTRKTITEIISR